ncbi:MAG: hypothetical protein ACUVWP_07240 [bacterium]
MSSVAFLNDKDDFKKRIFNSSDVTKIFFNPYKNNNTYRDYLEIKDIYNAWTDCNKTLKDILDIRDNKLHKSWVDIINSLLFIEIFFQFLRATYMTDVIKRIIEKKKPNCVFISKRLPRYFLDFVNERYSYLSIKGGRDYKNIRLPIITTMKIAFKTIIMIMKRISFIRIRRQRQTNKVLFLIQFWRVDLEMLLPVMRKFKEKGIEFNLITSSIKAYKKLMNEGFFSDEIDSGLSISDIFSALISSYYLWFSVVGKFNREARRFRLNRAFRRFLLYSEAFQPNTIFQFIITLYALDGIYNKLRPSLLIVADDLHSAGRAGCIIAKRRRISSICIQNGPISVEDFGFRPLFADKFIVWGEEVKSWLVSFGENENRIIVCGSPKHDELVLKIGNLKDSENDYILYASSMYEDKEASENILAVKTICKYLGRKLLVSPHPAMSIDYLINKLNDDSVEYYIEREGLISAIKKSRLVITGNSGAGIEAVLMGKDLIVYNPGCIKGFIPYAKYGAGIEVDSIDELKDAVKSILDGCVNLNEGRKRFISAYLSGLDGRSAERIFKVVEELKLK